MAEGIGGSTLNLAGRTGLPELAAVLAQCRMALSNDSGGMHLASAVGTKVVAVFGLTDPTRTGPLGEGHRVLAARGVPHHRDIPRDSRAARDALESIQPDRVIEAVLGVMKA